MASNCYHSYWVELMQELLWISDFTLSIIYKNLLYYNGSFVLRVYCNYFSITNLLFCNFCVTCKSWIFCICDKKLNIQYKNTI